MNIVCKPGTSIAEAAKSIAPGGEYHETVKLAIERTNGDNEKLRKELIDPESPLYKAKPFWPMMMYTKRTPEQMEDDMKESLVVDPELAAKLKQEMEKKFPSMTKWINEIIKQDRESFS